jgi:hypothetical protein
MLWLAGLAGGIAAYRFVSRRGSHAPPAWEPSPPTPPEPDPRAADLRAKLDESEPADGEEVGAEAPDDPDERRRQVHEEGRSALDDMKRSAG